MQSQERDIRFDILKVIGLLGVMLAHASPPAIIFQLRNFDVTLLVIVSGALFSLTSSRQAIGYAAYLSKRVSRLVIPAWTFITLFLLVALVAAQFITFPRPLTPRVIFESYFFMRGIGYLWDYSYLLIDRADTTATLVLLPEGLWTYLFAYACIHLWRL